MSDGNIRRLESSISFVQAKWQFAPLGLVNRITWQMASADLSLQLTTHVSRPEVKLETWKPLQHKAQSIGKFQFFCGRRRPRCLWCSPWQWVMNHWGVCWTELYEKSKTRSSWLGEHCSWCKVFQATVGFGCAFVTNEFQLGWYICKVASFSTPTQYGLSPVIGAWTLFVLHYVVVVSLGGDASTPGSKHELPENTTRFGKIRKRQEDELQTNTRFPWRYTQFLQSSKKHSNKTFIIFWCTSKSWWIPLPSRVEFSSNWVGHLMPSRQACKQWWIDCFTKAAENVDSQVSAHQGIQK